MSFVTSMIVLESFSEFVFITILFIIFNHPKRVQ